ncbi:hypothetical protein [Streptomyces flavofungini]|uniref:Secreted protein n=1 Tax=Streptomyces flavofungini TaxID=68200 RepID=A0ABS0XGC5_9ACTN|nr:hypothetical protein [Streptomyces flavofungini]MBJ3812041.1 hypothetical protein [Streptomyces flavofungini]GHC44647.1 hypothetical protein GCM10010349_06670 [Streptomyces flavofungini]
MTTTPPVPPTPPQPHAQYPQPPRPVSGHRGRTALVVVVVVLAVVAAGLGAWWWTRDGDEGPLAGRPRVTDARAGVSYGIPGGWERNNKEGDLIGAFTSSIASKGRGLGDSAEEGNKEERGGLALAGRSGAVPESALQSETERAARSNAEFFYPDGSSEVKESEATTVGGRPAHTVALAVRDGEGGTAHLRMTLVSLDGGRSAFLLGIATPGLGTGPNADRGPLDEDTVDDVLASVALT